MSTGQAPSLRHRVHTQIRTRASAPPPDERPTCAASETSQLQVFTVTLLCFNLSNISASFASPSATLPFLRKRWQTDGGRGASAQPRCTAGTLSARRGQRAPVTSRLADQLFRTRLSRNLIRHAHVLSMYDFRLTSPAPPGIQQHVGPLASANIGRASPGNQSHGKG